MLISFTSYGSRNTSLVTSALLDSPSIDTLGGYKYHDRGALALNSVPKRASPGNGREAFIVDYSRGADETLCNY